MKKIFILLLIFTLISCSSDNNSNNNTVLIRGKWKIIEWGAIINDVETPSTGIQLNPNKVSYYLFNNDNTFVSEIHYTDFYPTTQQSIDFGYRINGSYSISNNYTTMSGLKTILYPAPTNTSNYTDIFTIVELNNSSLKIHSNENNIYHYYKFVKL